MAPSSTYDMRLLDVVVEALARAPSALPTVDLFDTANCPRPEDVRRYIPTLREVSPTSFANVPTGYAMLATALENEKWQRVVSR